MGRIRVFFKRHLVLADVTDRLLLWISIFLQIAIFGLFIASLIENQWLVAFTAIVFLLLTFLPSIIERQFSVQLPVEFTFVNCLFLYAAFGLGEVRQYYMRFWWWDILLHSFSAIVIGLIGFLLVYIFLKSNRIKTEPLYVAMLSFGFAVTIGTLWEIFEFAMDWTFGFNMQKSGLVDTMTDLMVDAAGGLLAAWAGYQYLKGGDSLLADRFVRRFVAKNPHLFKQTTDSAQNIRDLSKD